MGKRSRERKRQEAAEKQRAREQNTLPSKPKEERNLFQQHNFDTKVEGVPTIIFTKRALDCIWCLVDECGIELSWLGTVERRGGTYIIDEIFVPKQKCSSANTEMDEGGIAAIAQDLIANRPNGVEVANQIRFWGHSHVNMDVMPSGTDDTTMKDFKDCPFFIRGIFNKHGKAKLDIWFNEMGFIVHDVPWTTIASIPDEIRQRMKAEIKDKVNEYTPSTYNYPRHSREPGRYQRSENKGNADKGDILVVGPRGLISMTEAEFDQYWKERHLSTK